MAIPDLYNSSGYRAIVAAMTIRDGRGHLFRLRARHPAPRVTMTRGGAALWWLGMTVAVIMAIPDSYNSPGYRAIVTAMTIRDGCGHLFGFRPRHPAPRVTMTRR